MIRPKTTLLLVQASCLVLALMLLAMMAGCLPPAKEFASPMANLKRNAKYTSRLSCFLTLKNDQGPAISLKVSSLEVYADELWLPLISAPLKIDSAVIGAGQLFLGGVAVPPGRYSRLRLTVTTGEVQNAEGKQEIIGRAPILVEVDLSADLNLAPDESRVLLITWDVEGSLRADNKLLPVLIATPSHRQLPFDLVFVTCPDIDTVFVVRADKNRVVDAFGLKGKPTYLAIDPEASLERLYVLATRDRMIKVVDLSTYRVVDFFPVPLNDEPTFMIISPDGQEAFLLDENSGYLIRMDLNSGRIVARAHIGYKPTYVAYLDDQNLLAVSLSLSNKVLLLDPLSLGVVRTISVGSLPQGLVVSDNQLYIAEYRDSVVSITDLNSGGNQGRINVGFGPRRLLAVGNQIYVSNFKDGSLSVLMPGQLGVIQEIYGLGRPQEMAFNQFNLLLYVADEETGSLAVIDVNSNQLVGHISLGARPFGLSVIQ